MRSSVRTDIISTVKNIHEKLWKYRYHRSAVQNVHEKLWKYRYYRSAVKNKCEATESKI